MGSPGLAAAAADMVWKEPPAQAQPLGPWDLRGPSRDVPFQGSFQEEVGGPRETWGKAIFLAPHSTHPFLHPP